MGNKNNDNYNDIEFRSDGVINRFDHELYDEAMNKAEKIIRVKRFTARGEKWRILEDNQVIFMIEASKLLKKEKEFLRTADGFNFLITQGKAGIKSINAFKIELKKRML